MPLLTGLTPDGQEVPVQVKPDGRLVAEGLTGPAGPLGPEGPQGPAGPQGPVGQDQPAGSVIWFAGASTPAGWLYCNGQAVSRSTYAALFAAIGTLYGAGNSSTTFNLPDLRGEFLRGWDDGRGVDAGRTLGSAQDDAFRAHNHDGLAHLISSVNLNPGAPDSVIRSGNGGSQPSSPFSVSVVGGTETRPRNIALRALIRT